jgi:tetratricopeptide (TPR) repeat protein
MTSGFKRTLIVWFVLMGLFLVVVIGIDKYGERVVYNLEARSKMEQAADLESEGKIEKAANLYKRAVDSDKDNPRYRALLARAYAKIGRFADAEIQAERVAELGARADGTDVMMLVARVYGMMGSWDKVRDTLQEVIDENPKCVEAYFEMAKAAERICDYTLMVQSLDEVARLGSHGSSPEYSSDVDARQRRIAELSSQDKGTQAPAETYYALGILYKEMGRWADAVEAFGNALDLQDLGADAHFWLGVDAEASGRREQAIDMYQRAVGLCPNHVGALRNLERSLLLNRVEEFPADRDAWYKLGLAYSGLMNWTEARIAFGRTIEVAPDFAEAHFRLGRTFEMLGETDEAAAAYARTLELSPNHVEAAAALAGAES